MKKTKLLVLIPIVTSLFSCSDDGYALAHFHLNYEGASSFSQVVNYGQDLLLPQEPERVDYVFNGWYLDSECTQSFDDFNEKLEEDINLYASWTPYEEIEDSVKLERLLSKLDILTGNVSKTEVIFDGLIGFPSLTSQIFQLYEEEVYNRYEDITTVDFYDYNKSYQFASQQFLYDDSNFYSLYQDIEGNGKNNEKNVAKFEENKVESFLSIDLLNLYCGDLYTLLDELKNGHSYDDYDYILDFNDTRLNSQELNYTFKVEMYKAKETDGMGLVEEIKMIECTIQFVNGKINRTNINEQYLFVLAAEQQEIYEYNIQSSYTTTDSFESFDGERFNPNNF